MNTPAPQEEGNLPNIHRRMVEWQGVGYAVYELNIELLNNHQTLRQTITALSDNPACPTLTDEYIEDAGLLVSALKALTNAVLRFQLCNGNHALDYFLSGGYTELPSLTGSEGIELLEIDVSESTLHDFFVGKPY